MRLTTGIAGLCLLMAAAPGTGLAQEDATDGGTALEAPGMVGFGMMGGLRAVFALIDSNGDGELSLQEIEAAHVRLFDAIDTDDDGAVTPEEIGAFFDVIAPSGVE